MLVLGRCYVFLGRNVKMRRLCHCQDTRAWHRVPFWAAAVSELSWAQSSWRWAVGPWDAGFLYGAAESRPEPSRLPLPHQPCCHGSSELQPSRAWRGLGSAPAAERIVLLWALLQISTGCTGDDAPVQKRWTDSVLFQCGSVLQLSTAL